MSRIKFVVARYEKDNYEKFLGTTIGNFDIKNVTNEEADSIYSKYNVGIRHWEDNGLKDDDVLVFCHADVKLIDKDFEEKVLYAFDNVPTLGVAGIIGSKEIHDTGGWWLCNTTLHKGHLLQWVDEEEKNKYHLNRGEGNHFDMCVVDGLCIFVRGALAKELKFDEEYYPKSYNFYDYDYSLSALEKGYNVGVLDIILEHKSAGYGIYEYDWMSNKEKFVNKWKQKGFNFPISVKQK
jgi:NAD-dependent dihydropyrimidine dehydrogenase PreA subunit